MKPHIFAAVITSVVTTAACSSSDNNGPTCTIVGTYIMTVTPASASEGCDDIPPPGPTDPPTFVTLSATGSGFSIEVSGFNGGCLATETEACKLQTKCDLQLTDATDPARSRGTLQAVWVFDAAGFHGINRTSIPPATSLPRGCESAANVTGQRQ